MPIITKSLMKFLLSKDKRGYSDDVQRSYYNDLVDKAKYGIEHLVLLSKNMPNRYTERIFNTQNLTPLFRAIFKVPEGDEDKAKILENITDEDRARLLELAQTVINLTNYDLAPFIAPELYRLLKEARIDTDLIGIKALWLTRRGYQVKKKKKTK